MPHKHDDKHNICTISGQLKLSSVRKFLACALQGLLMTPGRRLEPTLQKLERCAGETNPLGSAAKALIALIQRKSNQSLENLAVAIGASRDEEGKLRTNIDLLLKMLTAELSNSGEWKLIEMANRHELKYIFDSSQSCGHRFINPEGFQRLPNQESDTIEFTVPLANLTSADLAITEMDLQRELDAYNRVTHEVECGTCKETVELVRFMKVPHACDPDFLTLVCKPPVNIEARHLRLCFSQSYYEVKAVSHWHTERQVGAVSREKSDGTWWSHSVVKGQPPDFEFTEVQLESGMHFKDVAVLFAVRLDPVEENSEEEVAEEESDASGGLQQMDLQGQNWDEQLRMEGGAGRENEITMTNSIEISIEVEGKQPSGEAQVDSDDEVTKANIEQAKVNSRKENWKCLDQDQMVDRGLVATVELGLTCNAPPTNLPTDGRCLWSGIARSRNPSLTGADFQKEADELRTRAVGATMQWIDALSESELEVVQAVVAEPKKEPPTREQMIDDLAKYMRSTTYAGKMGDLLFQAASSFLHQPLIIIELRENGDYCLPVFPDSSVFKSHTDIAYPAILVRQEDHYEDLGLPEESKEKAVALMREFRNNTGLALRVGGQRTAPIATSTPVGNVDRERQSQERADQEKTSRSLSEEQDQYFPPSLASSARVESGNHSAQVLSALLVYCCLFV